MIPFDEIHHLLQRGADPSLEASERLAAYNWAMASTGFATIPLALAGKGGSGFVTSHKLATVEDPQATELTQRLDIAMTLMAHEALAICIEHKQLADVFDYLTMIKGRRLTMYLARALTTLKQGFSGCAQKQYEHVEVPGNWDAEIMLNRLLTSL